ncbi:MAG: nitric oxide reductase transcriptional regulator NorR [Janthinobacterium lividum]
MTSPSLLSALIPLVDDLSRELPDGERYQRLLRALRTLFPCDAAALLRLDGDVLVPLAIDGLTHDTLGLRFRVVDHPRLQVLLTAPGATRFPADSTLPDPYDGLVKNLRDQLQVHDCMGCALRIAGRPWGLITLDALDPARFESVDMAALQAFASLAAATVNVVTHIGSLAQRSEDERLKAEAYRLAAGLGAREIIGQSAAHRRLLDEIQVVGHSDLTVLITGESGVGKELVAQAIHAASSRANKPLITLNCAALPETLVESELFGHVRGAFSGAVADRRGKFDLAHQGTLFLDEVGELPLAAQAKLLRVLQDGRLQRVGSDREHLVDVRLIAATNRKLADEVRLGRFRADFYHRLAVYPLTVPPLRERAPDVLPIAGFFLEQNRARMGLRGLRLSADAQAALLAYPWPGNIRELEHLLGRTALRALAHQPQRPEILTLTARDLDLPDNHRDAPLRFSETSGASMPRVENLRQAMEHHERQLIRDSLARHQHNWSAAARELGIDRANLSRSARRLGLK